MTWQQRSVRGSRDGTGSHDLCSAGSLQLEPAIGIVLSLSLMKPAWSALLLSWTSPSLRMCPHPPNSPLHLGCLWGSGVPLSALLWHGEGALLSLGTSQGRVLIFVAE